MKCTNIIHNFTLTNAKLEFHLKFYDEKKMHEMFFIQYLNYVVTCFDLQSDFIH